MKKTGKAFTLTELLIVVVIIGVLATIALPKLSKILETRKTAEAEQMLTAVRNEQEARCTLSKSYQGDLRKLGAYQAGKNFEYLQKVGAEKKVVGIIAKGKKYQLEIPSYADGRICCSDGECADLAQNYPTCKKLTEEMPDYVKPNADCGVDPVTPPITPCTCTPEHIEGKDEITTEGSCTFIRAYHCNVLCKWEKAKEVKECGCDESEHYEGEEEEISCDCGTKKIIKWHCNPTTLKMQSHEEGECRDASADKKACEEKGASIWNPEICECKCDENKKAECQGKESRVWEEDTCECKCDASKKAECEANEAYAWDEETCECNCKDSVAKAHKVGKEYSSKDGCTIETTWIGFKGYPDCVWESEERVVSCPCTVGEREVESCVCGVEKGKICKEGNIWEEYADGTCGLTQEEKQDCRCDTTPPLTTTCNEYIFYVYGFEDTGDYESEVERPFTLMRDCKDGRWENRRTDTESSWEPDWWSVCSERTEFTCSEWKDKGKKCGRNNYNKNWKTFTSVRIPESKFEDTCCQFEYLWKKKSKSADPYGHGWDVCEWGRLIDDPTFRWRGYCACSVLPSTINTSKYMPRAVTTESNAMGYLVKQEQRFCNSSGECYPFGWESTGGTLIPRSQLGNTGVSSFSAETLPADFINDRPCSKEEGGITSVACIEVQFNFTDGDPARGYAMVNTNFKIAPEYRCVRDE